MRPPQPEPEPAFDVAAVLAQKAWSLHDIGRGEEALDHARRARAADPESLMAAQCFAVMARRYGDAEEADLATSSLLTLAPDDVAGHVERTLYLVSHGLEDATTTMVQRRRARAAALEHAQQAVALAPQETAAHQALGMAHAVAGNHDAAMAALDRATALAPDRPGPWVLRAEAAGRRARNRWLTVAAWLAAASWFTAGLSLAVAAIAWGIGRLVGRRHEEAAVVAASEAVRRAPEDPDVLMMYAQAQARRFRPLPAAEALLASAHADLGGAAEREIVQQLGGLWSSRAFLLCFGTGLSTIWVMWLAPIGVEIGYGIIAGAAMYGIAAHLVGLRRSLRQMLPAAASGSIDARLTPMIGALVYTAISLLTFSIGTPDGQSAVWWWFNVVQAPVVVGGLVWLATNAVRARRAGHRAPEPAGGRRSPSTVVRNLHWAAAVVVGWFFCVIWVEEAAGPLFVHPAVTLVTLAALWLYARTRLDHPADSSMLPPLLTWAVLTTVLPLAVLSDTERTIPTDRVFAAVVSGVLVLVVAVIELVRADGWLGR